MRETHYFAGPRQKTIETTIPKLQDLQNGATINLIPVSDVFKDDVVWRKAITKVMLGSTDVTNKVKISEAYTYYDQFGALAVMPSKITVPGSLFTTANNYTLTIKTTGFQQDGGLVEIKKADYKTTISAPTVPTRTGYTFVGWYRDAKVPLHGILQQTK